MKMPDGILMNSGSYFPPVDCWSSRLPSPVVPGPAPLLPTPIPTALPSTLGGTLNEVPPHVVDPEVPLIPPPTCSCPVTDTCVAESLALLLGSFKLLYQVVTKLKKSVAGRLDLGKDAVGPIATALSRFEVSIRKLLAPVLEAEGIEMESLLLQQWLRPVQAPAIDDDVCSWIRRKVDSLLIDVVDTFPPMQHTVHMLLVRHEFGSRRLQSVLEALKGQVLDSGRLLLLEANRQLVQFSVKSDNAYKQSLLEDLLSQVDGLVRQVDRGDVDAVLNDHKL